MFPYRRQAPTRPLPTVAQRRTADGFVVMKQGRPAGSATNPQVPVTRAEYDLLPAGTYYIAPDGSYGPKAGPPAEERGRTDAPENGVVQGGAARLGYVGVQSQLARRRYDDAAARLDPNDRPARTALKAKTRLETPAEVLAVIEKQRSDGKPLPGSGGTANRTNAAVTAASNRLGAIGKASAVLTLATAADDIARSNDRPRAAAANAAAFAGGLAGGEVGAGWGALTPAPEVLSPVGGLLGAMIGGYVGYHLGDTDADLARMPRVNDFFLATH